MAGEGAKREGTELLGLPPRKRFKVMEQQRRMEVVAEEEAPVGSQCSDITNVLHRVSPKKLTSQGFLVLEKQKYKLQQQKLQENLAPVPVMPPLPPRPIAVKRKDPPALPLPAPPAVRLKFQQVSMVDSTSSSSAFKSWGTPSPKKIPKSDTPPLASKSSGSSREHRKDHHALKPKRHHQASLTSPAVPQHAKTWTMAPGTTCSINKAQEDVEMVVCEAPVSTSDVSASDEDVIGSDGSMVEASVIVPVEVKTVRAASHPIEDVATDPASSVAVDDIHVAVEDTTTVAEAAHLDAHNVKEVVENAQQVDEPKLEVPVDLKDLCEEEPESDAEKAMAFEAPEACESSHFASPLATDASTVALVESPIDFETVQALEDGETFPAKKGEEQAAKVVADEVQVDEEKERVAATTTLRDSLAVTEGQDDEQIKTKAGLLAEIDERAEKIFKRMLERECYAGCDDEEEGSGAQFFFASNGVNNFNSLVTGIGAASYSGEADSSPKQKNGGGRVVDVPSLDEDHQKYVERPTLHVPNKPPEEVMPEASSSRASEGYESPVPTHISMKLQETVCKSSKEDSDWDLDVEMPNFGFGKRSGGMTQRVKAPGRWSQSAEVNVSKLEDKVADEEDAGEVDDEGACDVCRSADAKPSDPIVYCDGCDIPVHADCYGNPLNHGIPEGDWFCAQCQSKRPDSRCCCLCPRTGGVMKMTTDGNWAHLSCAVFVPEVFFRNADDMEGIDTSHVPSRRYLAKCCVCKSNGGACVDCTEIGCKSSFHVSCALKRDLAMEFRNGRSGAIVISFCQEHTAAWDEQQERKGRSKYKIVSREPQKTKLSKVR